MQILAACRQLQRLYMLLHCSADSMKQTVKAIVWLCIREIIAG